MGFLCFHCFYFAHVALICNINNMKICFSVKPYGAPGYSLDTKPPTSNEMTPSWQGRSIAGPKLRLVEFSAYIDQQRDGDQVCTVWKKVKWGEKTTYYTQEKLVILWLEIWCLKICFRPEISKYIFFFKWRSDLRLKTIGHLEIFKTRTHARTHKDFLS